MNNDLQKKQNEHDSLFSERFAETINSNSDKEVFSKLPDGDYKALATATIKLVKNETSMNFGRKKLVINLRVVDGIHKNKIEIFDYVLNPSHLDVPRDNSPEGINAHNADVKAYFQRTKLILQRIGVVLEEKTEEEIFGQLPNIESIVEFKVSNAGGQHKLYINKLLKKGLKPEILPLSNYPSGNDAPLGAL